jgi:hypothetical protein
VDGGLESIGCSGDLLNSENVLNYSSPSNITRMVYDRIFPAIKTNKVEFKHICIFGQPGSGKTVLLNALASEAMRRYGGELNLIPTYAIKDAIWYINDKKVQFLIVDDAIGSANSRQPQKQAQDIGDFYRVRHIYEEKAKTSYGIVITIWAAQRFKSLDTVFRNGDVLIFKTGAADPDDAKIIEKYIGPEHYDQLCEIWDRIGSGDDDAKSESIAYVPAAKKTGTFIGKLSNYHLRFIGAENNEATEPEDDFSFSVEATLEAYKKRPDWKEAAKVFELWREGKIQEDIADKLGIDRSNISRWIKRMRGELSRVSGERYENWKANHLKNIGYEVDHQGRIGEPDIVIKDKATNQYKVVSCKALYLDRRLTLPVEEIAPEIRKAKELHAIVIVSVYDLKNKCEVAEQLIDPDHPPKNLTIEPEA